MPMLDCTSIRKSFGQTRVLDDVSIAIEPGELVTLLGPSGCGKTTLLRSVAGLVEIDLGTVKVQGMNLAGLPIHKRQIGMVFQSHALFPHMSVEDNVGFGMKMHGADKDRIRTRVAEALKLVHLADYGRRRPHELSGGQQQRVAIARAVANDPALLLLDEPFGALDRKLREALQIELRKLTKDLGMTAVFVTHDQEEAMILSDRIAVMSGGRIQQFASPREVFDTPANTFVANFMGFENMIPATSATALSGGRVSVTCAGDTTFMGELPPGGSLDASQPVVALRSERITLSNPDAPGVAPSDNTLGGRIVDIAYRGTAYVVSVETTVGTLTVKSSAPPPGLANGDAVRMTWAAEACRVLNTTPTGEE